MWDSDQVRLWLESRIAAARLDQAAADQQGYAAQDDYDKAAAEEWVCRAMKNALCIASQTAFADRLKALLGQDDFPITGIYDDRRFERHVRTNLRKLVKMAKANLGFENTLHYQ